jgi:hypothetical protein
MEVSPDIVQSRCDTFPEHVVLPGKTTEVLDRVFQDMYYAILRW